MPTIQSYPFVEHVVLQNGDVKWATSISLIISRTNLIWRSMLMVAVWCKLGLSLTRICSRNNQSAVGFPGYHFAGWIPGSTSTSGYLYTHWGKSSLVVPHSGSLMITLVLDKAGPTISSLRHTHTHSSPSISSVSTEAIQVLPESLAFFRAR